VAINAAEEETLEALKTWWNENGRTLAIAVILVFGGYTGWLLWQNARADAVEAASVIYEDILTLSFPGDQEQAISDADSNQIIAYGEQLMSEHTDTVYARYGALYAAQQYVRQDNLPAAETALQWVLDNPREGMFVSPDPGLMLTATLRLGRIILAQGDAERALSLVNSVDPQGFEAGFAELRGDIYLALDRYVDAREAYLAAQQAGSGSDGLRMKLQSLPTDS
jgi:predicted negative regulator of RcsB-dependent stress response